MNNNKKLILRTAFMAMLLTVLMCMPVFATNPTSAAAALDYKAEADKLLAPAYYIAYIIEGIVILVGIVMVLWGVFNLAKALPAHDQSGITAGILWIVGGILCIGVGAVVAILTNGKFS